MTMREISPVKKQLVKDIRTILESSNGFFLVTYKGLTVAAFSDLRRALSAIKAEAHVVPNNLMEIAAVESGFAKSRDEVSLSKDTALITGGTDPLQVAKILKDYLKKYDKVTVKFGYFEGRKLDPKGVEALAAIPSRETLYAMLLGVLQSAPRGLVSVLSAKAKEMEGAAAN